MGLPQQAVGDPGEIHLTNAVRIFILTKRISFIIKLGLNLNSTRLIEHRLVIIVFTVSILLCSGCGRPPEIYNPFRVPRQEFYPQLGRIAIVPMKFDLEISHYDEIMTVFDSLIANELREDELEIVIVPTEKSDSLQDAFMKDVGGIFDSYTGKLDIEKTKTWRKMIIGEVKEKYNVNAIMFVSIRKVRARFSYDKAMWDGASEGIGKDKFLKFIMGMSHSGSMPALSLVVELRQVNDSLLYLNAGGIQVLRKIGSNSRSEQIPSEEILTDFDQIQDAVHYALNPLLGIVKRMRPGSTKKPDARSTLLESK